jgi:MFS family permease
VRDPIATAAIRRLRGLSAAALPDLSPLKDSPSYRWLWLGQLISASGTALRLVAVPYQVYLLTGSTLAVGLIGAAQAIPLITLTLFGGVFADRVDRRRLLLVTQVGLTAVSVALALTTQLGLVSLPLLYALVAIGACFSALDGPTRAALAPTLVERHQIRAAVTLNQVLFQTSAIAGPALGGVVIAALGLVGAYWIDAASFVAAIVGVIAIRVAPRAPTEHPAVLRSLWEGLSFLRSRRLLLATMLLDFLATFFGTPRALAPFYADQVFHVGPEGLGLIYASFAVGALLAVFASGWTKHVHRQGLAILAAVSVFGAAIAAFGAMDQGHFALALTLLAAAGAADAVSSILRGTLLQLEVPDALRGRLNSINIMFVLGGPTVGQVESGVVAGLWSPVAAAISGGLACVGSVVAIALLMPELRRYRSDRPAEAGVTGR